VELEETVPETMAVDDADSTLVLVENSSTFSASSLLDSSADTRHDGATVHSELTTGFNFDCDATPSALGESISQLFYAVAFSHLSCPRYVSQPIALDSSVPQVHRALSPGQDISASCADNSSNEPPSSTLFANLVPSTPPGSISPLPPSSPGFSNDSFMELSCDAPAYPSALPSSPVPSSSPPNFFTSSPTLNPLENSPPTSPVSVGKLTGVLPTSLANPLKRPRTSHTTAASPGGRDDLGEEPVKKKVRHAHDTRIYGTYAVSRS
jgi:hypothetical protein